MRPNLTDKRDFLSYIKEEGAERLSKIGNKYMKYSREFEFDKN